MTKTDQYFTLMIEQNKQAFDLFRQVHDEFATNPAHYKEVFNEMGREIQDIVRRYENMLCAGSENGGYGKFSTKLSEKLQAKILKEFPKYHHIGA